MNIVKIKDVKVTTGLYGKESLYESSFRGKYVICVKWNYCVPMENYTQSELISQTQSSSIIPPDDSIPYNNLTSLNVVDNVETTKVNDYSEYIKYNSFTPDGLTSAQVKMFRTWLATTILSLNKITDSDTIHMLTYYKESMHDSVVVALKRFGSSQSTIITESGCGCTKTTTQINEGCDTLSIYKGNIKQKMIDEFSDLYFWLQFNTSFISMFKVYIDNIIKMNLVLTPDISNESGCLCIITENTQQTQSMDRLKQLSQSLQYIISNDISGHKTYIHDSLTYWATNLYENMEWV